MMQSEARPKKEHVKSGPVFCISLHSRQGRKIGSHYLWLCRTQQLTCLGTVPGTPIDRTACCSPAYLQEPRDDSQLLGSFKQYSISLMLTGGRYIMQKLETASSPPHATVQSLSTARARAYTTKRRHLSGQMERVSIPVCIHLIHIRCQNYI